MMSPTPRATALAALLSRTGWADAAHEPLPGDASFRRYIRLRQSTTTAMLMDAPPEREDVRPYVQVARHLHTAGYAAPAVLGVDETHGYVLCEDLGDALFTRTLAAGLAEERTLYEAAVDLLAAWHADPQLHQSHSALRLKEYNAAELLREVTLFADWFLPEALGKEKAAALRDEFISLWEALFAAAPMFGEQFVHRDYHADNLLWLPGAKGHARVGLLDFQDALWGHPAYDLVSLLEDARRDVPAALAEAMFMRYVAHSKVEEHAFRAAYAALGAQRNTKIIGIFVRLARRDRKPHYLKHLPRVWAHLMHDVQHPLLAPVREWIECHVPAHMRGEIAVS